MAGYTVSKDMLNQSAGDSVLALRTAFAQAGSITSFLADHPVADGVDPLVAHYEFSEDEAYLFRVVFERLGVLRDDAAPTMELARKFTGLR